MRFFSKSVHTAAYEGDEKFIKEFIKKKQNLNLLNDSNSTPLLRAVSGSQYSVAILLLEAGATPHYHPESTLCLPPIHLMVTYVRIRAMKLLIWFDPNYESVLGSANTSVQNRIATWSQSAKDLLKSTAADANTVIANRKAAEVLEEKSAYLEAALKYVAIAEVFYRHSQLERDYKFELQEFVKYSGLNLETVKEDDKKAQQIFIEYYLVQAEKYLSKFIGCINQAAQTAQKSEALTKYKALYQTVLNELIEICKIDVKRKSDYLNKLAHLLVEQSDSSLENTSSEEAEEKLTLSSLNSKNDETKPLLVTTAMNIYGLHKRHTVKLQQEKSSNISDKTAFRI